MTERTVAPGANSETCATQASTRVRLRTATSPVSGLHAPRRISSKVDFPEPFGPISPMRSPSETVKEISWKSGSAPYRLESPCAVIIGGKRFGFLPQSV